MKKSKIADHSQKMLGTAVASSVLAAALMTTPIAASATASERCADIVKGGSNGCAVKTLGISCQGNATEDNMEGAWVKVPEGTCANIVSICAGDAEAPEGTNDKKLAKACDKLAEQEEGVEGGRVVDKFGETVAVVETEDAYEDAYSDTDAAHEHTDAVEAETESMIDQVDAMESEVDSMTGEADAMQDKVEAIEAESMTDKVESIQSQAEDLKAKAESMQNKVEGLQDNAEKVLPAVE